MRHLEAAAVLKHGKQTGRDSWRLGNRSVVVHTEILPGFTWGRVWEYRRRGRKPVVVKVEEL